VEEVLTFTGAAGWEAWLAVHHNQAKGVWVKVAKKGSAHGSITAAEAGEVALCYGWIDSVRRAASDGFFLQRYSRRKPNSSWSRVNVDRAQSLIAAGRMRPPGFAEINAAKADGRWQTAYESQRYATVPPDLTMALAMNQPAEEAFSRLGKTDRYLVILPLLKARTPKARAARLRKTIERLAANRPSNDDQ
jgi:uncharacterized protein YdeI (YjbR/CyaY-like superfamily)